MRKRKILWLIKGLGLGGAEMLFPIALPYLDRERYDYEVAYFLPWKDTLVSRIEEQGVPVTCLEVTRHGDLTAMSRLQRLFRERRVDLVHAHLPHPGVLARFAGFFSNVPVIYTEHNQWGRLNPLMRAANHLTFGFNTWSIAVSREVADSMRGIDRSRLTVVENGVDVGQLQLTPDERDLVRAELGIGPDAFVIGKVANLTPKKNHECLIDAFAQFLREHPVSILLLIGQPAGRQVELRKRADSLGIAHRIIFTGPRNDVARLVRTMDIFAISSDFEGLPVAMLEGMALGVPIVATSVGGIPSVMEDGRHGLLVPPRRPDTLAQALLRLANDSELRRRLSVNAQAHVRENFDISTMVRSVEAIYQHVLDHR